MLKTYGIRKFIGDSKEFKIEVKKTPFGEEVLKVSSYTILRDYRHMLYDKVSTANWAFIAQICELHPKDSIDLITKELEYVELMKDQYFLEASDGDVYHNNLLIADGEKSRISLCDLNEKSVQVTKGFMGILHGAFEFMIANLSKAQDLCDGLNPIFQGQCTKCQYLNNQPIEESENSSKIIWGKDQILCIRLMHILHRLGYIKLSGEDDSEKAFFAEVFKIFNLKKDKDYLNALYKSQELKHPERYFDELQKEFLEYISELFENKQQRN